MNNKTDRHRAETIPMRITPAAISTSACAVLLALNLMVTTAPASPDIAPATANATGPPVPYIVKLLPLMSSRVYRVWSDGQVDTYQRPADGSCDFESELQAGPVEHPFPVVDAVQSTQHDQGFMLTYGDGRVDLIGGPPGRCTIMGVGTPSFCPGDVDRNGNVGIEDFLLVLGQWGCQ